MAYTHPKGAGAANSASASEALSAVDVVSASWGTTVGFSDTLTASVSESYPAAITLAQLGYRGRRAPILFRQPETLTVPPVFYSDSVADLLSASDAVAVFQVGFGGAISEPLFAIDAVDYPPSGGGAGEYPPGKKKKKRYVVQIDDELREFTSEAAAKAALTNATSTPEKVVPLAEIKAKVSNADELLAQERLEELLAQFEEEQEIEALLLSL
jgi:hypothetical protein